MKTLMVDEKHCSIHGGTGDGSDGCVECDEPAMVAKLRADEAAAPKRAIDLLREAIAERAMIGTPFYLAAVGHLAICEQLETLTKTLEKVGSDIHDASLNVERMSELLPDVAKAINNYTEETYHRTR